MTPIAGQLPLWEDADGPVRPAKGETAPPPRPRRFRVVRDSTDPAAPPTPPTEPTEPERRR